MFHNHHMRAFAAMMIGHRNETVETLDNMVQEIPIDWARENAGIADGVFAMPLEARLRFGMWEDILKSREPEQTFPMSRALFHYARGIAYASKNRLIDSKREREAFLTAKSKVPSTTTFGNNKAAHLLEVADKLLQGEILYRDGKKSKGIAALKKGVTLEDNLRYSEPPDWIHPIRHALGAILLEERRFTEAEAVYRKDLQLHPENGWALFGLGQSLKFQGKETEALEVEKRFQKAWATADVELTSSCYCQPGE
jgi:tetratricopeptide (TPR) repeat protein